MDPSELGRLLIERVKASGLNLQLIADFTVTTVPTVDRWVNRSKYPEGENLNKLWHLVAIAGIESPEMDALPQFGRYVGRLMALGIISLKEAMQIYDASTPQGVYRKIRGELIGDDSRERTPKFTLTELKEMYEHDVVKKEGELRQKLSANSPATVRPIASLPDQLPVSAAAKPARAPEPSLTPLFASSDLIAALAAYLGATLPLLRHVLSDRVTPEDRARLRELVGQDNMFLLVRLVRSAQSERVRDTEV